MSVQIVEEFISHYERERFYFDQLAHNCADLCNAILVDAGIQASVTFRSKALTSLKNKLLDRNRDRDYKNAEEIRADIIDLAGVRISLLYLNDLRVVESLLSKKFQIIDSKLFSPYGPNPTKYMARHLRVKMTSGETKDLGESKDMIEIQITSRFHGAWADMQHDIDYKPRAFDREGLLSQLDILHNLVLKCEIQVNNVYNDYRQRATISQASYEDSRLDDVPINSLVVGDDNKFYYLYASDRKRYIFPNEATLRTWFPEALPKVYKIKDEDLRHIPLGGNITYRPGVRLIKIKTDPSIYAVEKWATLRKIEDNSIIESLYGKDWQSIVDTIPDMFFVNYSIGRPIKIKSDHNPKEESETATLYVGGMGFGGV